MKTLRATIVHGLRQALAINFVLCAGTVVSSADPMTPLFLGTAGAGTVLGFGIDAAFGNPAQLGWQQPSRFQLRLAGLGAGVANNSFGLADYRRYNGTDLDAQDKAAILSNIPLDGLRLRTDGNVSALATRLGRWSLRADGFGVVRGRLDRQLLELLFYGNADRAAWTFANTDGEGMAGGQVVLSHGRAIVRLWGRELYAGFSASYIRGLYYARSEDTRAALALQEGGLSGAARADWITAEGGFGWGLDLGLAMEPWPQWVAALKLENAVHQIHWDRNVRARHYETSFENLTVDNFDDSLLVTTESSRPGAAFSRGLPPSIRAGLGRIGNRLRVATELSVSLRDGLGASTRPRLAGGVEYSPIHLLPLRFGAAVGGESGWAVGWGAGLLLGPVRLDTGIKIDKGFWVGSGRGMSGSLSLDMSF